MLLSERIITFVVKNICLFRINEIEIGLALIRNLLQKRNFENGFLIRECNFFDSLLKILITFDSPSIQYEAILSLIEIVESMLINSNELSQKSYMQIIFDYNIVNIIENIIIKTTDMAISSLATRLISLLNRYNEMID